MLDRASTFADPKIISMLQTQFIPVAIDQFYQRQQKDAEGDFYRKIAGQGPRGDFKGTTQGLYVAGPDGKLIAFNNNRGADRVRRVLEQSLKEFRPGRAEAIESGAADPRFDRAPPEGGLVVRVTAKVLGGYEEPADQWQKIFQSALARDNLWVRKDEHQALVRSQLPESLLRRIARFHLVDNTRGEPPMWDPKDIRKMDLKLVEGKIAGSVHLESENGDRGYRAELLGFIETEDGKVTRFDLVAKGTYWGEGTYTRGAPKGKFPFGVAFSLADGKDEADRVPPQGSKGWLPSYIE